MLREARQIQNASDGKEVTQSEGKVLIPNCETNLKTWQLIHTCVAIPIFKLKSEIQYKKKNKDKNMIAMTC